MLSVRIPTLVALLVLAACETGGGPPMQTVNLGGPLSGASEVPPVNTPARGDAQATFDKSTKQLKWTVPYSGLSGPATAAHFHGPAAPSANAGVAINASPGGPPPNPITGMATLTDAQAQQLLAGQMYFNIHTAANPGGEIRGQIVPK